MRWWTLLLVLWPLTAPAAEYLTVDDTTKSFLAELLPCSGGSNAVTYNATTKAFGCNTLAGGPGGTNTASNLGGGLANYDSASGTDLRFNTFWATDFDLAANLFKIDDTKWATDTQVATAVAANAPFTYVTASADLAGNPATLEGADIGAAITACGTDVCQVNLLAGTYVDVCLKVTRDEGTHLIGRGIGVTILKPLTDPSTCAATDQGQMLQFSAADNIEVAYLEMDGDKEFLTAPAACAGGFNSCGAALTERNLVGALSHNGYVHDIYVHDFMGHGFIAQSANHWIVESVTFDNFGCVQDSSPKSCGCGAGDPGDCRGWDLKPDLGLDIRVNPGALAYGTDSRNSTIRHSIVGWAPHHGLEVFIFSAVPCVGTGCPENISFEDNDVANSILVNSAQHVRILRNRVHNPGLSSGPLGDVGVGILVGDAVYDVVIESNLIYDNASSGIVIKALPPGGITIDSNVLTNNCTDHSDQGNIWVRGGTDAGVNTRDLVVANNYVFDSAGCDYALTIDDTGSGVLMEGRIQILGGTYATGAIGTVQILSQNLEMRGLNITGDLEFGATANGLASGLSVSGSTTNTGGVCILEADSTPIPSTCVNP